MIRLSDLYRLRVAGVLPAARFIAAAGAVRDPVYWSRWALRALLGLGAAHLLAGIVFFFAFNWAAMPAFAKFAVIEAGILFSVIAALLVGQARPFGQVCALAATVLTGTLLAVIGQVYQTGADAYELFLAWAVLVLPWVVISNNAAHWLVWAAIAACAINFHNEQVLIPAGVMARSQTLLLSSLWPILVLGARELAAARGLAWLAPRWTRMVLLLWLLLQVLGIGLGGLFDNLDLWTTQPFFVAVAAALAWVYRGPLADAMAQSLVIGAAAIFLMVLGGRLIEETIGFDWDRSASLIAALALLVLWCAGIAGAMAKLLRETIKHRAEDRA